MSRLPPIAKGQLNPAQRAVYDTICAGPRGAVAGPFTVLLNEPELAARIESLGKQLRFESCIPGNLRELATCIVGAHWKADYEWYAHARLARTQGISNETLEAIGHRLRPSFQNEAEGTIYAFVKELLSDGHVTEPVYRQTLEVLGQRGVVELTALVGYYSLLAFVINAFCVDVPTSAEIPWRTA